MNDFELIELNRFKRLNELSISNELLRLLDLKEIKGDHEVSYIKTSDKSYGIYINTKTDNTIKTSTDPNTGSRKGSIFNIAKYEIFLDSFMKRVFPENNAFYSKSKTLLDDDEKEVSAYFDIKNFEQAFKFPVDMSKNYKDMADIIINPDREDNNSYTYPTDKDAYDIKDIQKYKNEMIEKIVKNSKKLIKKEEEKLEKIYKEKKIKAKDDLIRRGFNLDDVKKGLETYEKELRNEIDELEPNYKKKLNKETDEILEKTLKSVKSIVNSVKKEKKINAIRNNTIVYLVSYTFEIKDDVDDPSKLVKQLKDFKVIPKEDTFDDITEKVRSKLNCKTAKKHYKDMTDSILSYITGIDKYPNRFQRYYDIKTLLNDDNYFNKEKLKEDIKNDTKNKKFKDYMEYEGDGNSKTINAEKTYDNIMKKNPSLLYSEDYLKSYHDFKEGEKEYKQLSKLMDKREKEKTYGFTKKEIINMRKAEMESTIRYLKKKEILKKNDIQYLDGTNSKKIDYNQTLKNIEANKGDIYKKYFTDTNKPDEEELEDVSMSPLDYIIGIYKKDKELLSNIVDDIRELNVLTPDDVKELERAKKQGKETEKIVKDKLKKKKTIKQYQEEGEDGKGKSLFDIMRIYLGFDKSQDLKE